MDGWMDGCMDGWMDWCAGQRARVRGSEEADGAAGHVPVGADPTTDEGGGHRAKPGRARRNAIPLWGLINTFLWIG